MRNLLNVPMYYMYSVRGLDNLTVEPNHILSQFHHYRATTGPTLLSDNLHNLT